MIIHLEAWHKREEIEEMLKQAEEEGYNKGFVDGYKASQEEKTTIKPIPYPPDPITHPPTWWRDPIITWTNEYVDPNAAYCTSNQISLFDND